VNSIPSRVQLSLDVRDISLERRDGVMRSIEEAWRNIATKRQVCIQSELVNADAPAQSDPAIVETLSESCRKQHQAFLPMVSRAYHDSLFMSRVAPVAMVFIPCRNGYSHRPDEYASPQDIKRGAVILADALASLAG
jgi:N-carbamoyl-L-amino-acid hydrolase